MAETVDERDSVRRRRSRRDRDAARVYRRGSIFDCNNSSIRSLDESSIRVRAHVLGQVAVIRVYHRRMLRRSRRL